MPRPRKAEKILIFIMENRKNQKRINTIMRVPVVKEFPVEGHPPRIYRKVQYKYNWYTVYRNTSGANVLYLSEPL